MTEMGSSVPNSDTHVDATASQEQRDTQPLLRDILVELNLRTAALSNAEPVLAAFATWVGASRLPNRDVLAKAARGASEKIGASRQYQDVAVLGFACSKKAGTNEVEAAHFDERFRDGLHWMQGRRFFLPGKPLAFEADGVALIGIAAGICAAGAPGSREADRKWLGSILRSSSKQTVRTGWESGLLCAAAVVLDRADADSRTAPPPPDDLPADLAAALAPMGLLRLSQNDEQAARLLIVNAEYQTQPEDRAAVQSAALRWLLRQAATALPRRATVDDLVELLKGVENALKRWPWEATPRTARTGATAQRWDLQNEYHVQSLLWALLAPIFDDLEDEEYLRSLGHKHPRADLAIPSLGVIVEVKFMRHGTQSEFAGLIGEISSDTGLYLSVPSDFTLIVPFIWDDSRSNDQHPELLRGLRQLRGIANAVVVSRPGRWT